jgi:hypothetical protein
MVGGAGRDFAHGELNPTQRPGRDRMTMLVVLIALHSYVVGIALLFSGPWALRLGQWEPGGTFFFMRQGGAFHVIVASLYLWAWFRHRSTFPILLAKSVAVVFLATMSLLGEPSAVLASGILDAMMLVILLVVRARS